MPNNNRCGGIAKSPWCTRRGAGSSTHARSPTERRAIAVERELSGGHPGAEPLQCEAMSQAIPPETEQGYGTPSVRQFSVFLDNRVGKLLDLVQLFDDNPEVSLRAFSVLDSSDHAVVRLIFDNADAARHLMRRRQFTFSETDLLVVELGGDLTLKHICMYLLGAELNIRFAYPVLRAEEDHPRIALAVDDNTLAGQILRRKGFRLLGEEDLA